MSEIYAFVFSLGLGIAARLLYIGATALAKRTDLIPVTVILDILTVAVVGGAFAAYVILTGTVLAPYMFAALLAGYLFAYWLTKKRRTASDGSKEKPKKSGKPRKSEKTAAR